MVADYPISIYAYFLQSICIYLMIRLKFSIATPQAKCLFCFYCQEKAVYNFHIFNLIFAVVMVLAALSDWIAMFSG